MVTCNWIQNCLQEFISGPLLTCLSKDSTICLTYFNNTHEYWPIDNIMSQLKQVNKGPLKNSFEQFYIQTIITINLFKNKIQEHEIQCTSWYLTFNYVTSTHYLDLHIPLPAYLPFCNTINASRITSCSNLLVHTLQISHNISYLITLYFSL